LNWEENEMKPGMGIIGLAMLMTSALCAQSTITGKVSINEHPASSATVYFMRQDEKEFAAGVWLEAYNHALAERLKEASQTGNSYEKALACRSELLAFHEAYEAAFAWATRMQQGQQMTAAITDEAGNFSVDVQPGNYIALAISKAGQSWWEGKASTKSGNTTITLSEPVVSCTQ
jgi:hypothetical protein